MAEQVEGGEARPDVTTDATSGEVPDALPHDETRREVHDGKSHRDGAFGRSARSSLEVAPGEGSASWPGASHGSARRSGDVAAAFGAALAHAFEDASAPELTFEEDSSASALADALESVAERVRRGELRASRFRAGMGDAAALADALAAVLGV